MRPAQTSLPLPVDELVGPMLNAVRGRRNLVIVAEPGAGKTTRLPRELLTHQATPLGIVVLEPRRIAARLSAERVAFELGEAVGDRVGYETRDKRAISARTQLRYLTEGVLTRRLLAERQLSDVGIVIFDELHERHLHTDLCLALCLELQRGSRPDLVIIAMSATLPEQEVASYLGADILRSEGRLFPVTIEHRERPDDRPLGAQVAAGVAECVGRVPSGDVLVFLPSSREIRSAREALQGLAARRELSLCELFGSQSPKEQDQAMGPSAKRKVILATNVAETSITIDGVTCVVDSGLALVASCSPWSGLPQLAETKISRASAKQRAGRAGRTQAGFCYRLYSQSDHAARPEAERPEMLRLELSEAALVAAALGHSDLTRLRWLTAPPDANREAAERLLALLGATETIEQQTRISETGRRMLMFPTHPRHARMLVEAERRGVSAEVAAMVGLLAQRSLPSDGRADAAWSSDLLWWVEQLLEQEASGQAGRSADLTSALRDRDRFTRLSKPNPPPTGPEAYEAACLISVLTGYPDRVGRVRVDEQQRRQVMLCQGSTIALSEASRVRHQEFVCAVSVEERSEGTRRRSQVRLASAIQSDWLLELFTDAVVDEETVAVAPGQDKVMATRTLRYESLVLERTETKPADAEQAAAVLVDAFLSRGLRSEQEGDLLRLERRLELLAEHLTEFSDLPATRDRLRQALVQAAWGKRSLSELGSLDVASLLFASLDAKLQQALREHVPLEVQLGSGRRAQLTYPKDAAPFVSSRMQDFFGLADGPSILRGRVPVVLHLCAPNQRPVQVTTDLAGFWDRHYPALARELRRRYPRHPFPEDPRTAEPPPRRR